MKLLETRQRTPVSHGGKESRRATSGISNDHVAFLPISSGELVQRSETEAKSTIAGILNSHIDLLPLHFPDLKEQFDATMNDPAIVRQKSRFGKKVANILSGHTDSGDKKYIYDAYELAYDTHERKNHQIRKYSNEPYIVHPLRVALLSIKLAQAMGVPVTSDLIVAALTHDALEDSPMINGKGRLNKQQNIESLFGSNSPFTGKRGRSIAAHTYALSHHDVKTDGKVDEHMYYKKIINGSKKAVIIRAIVKAADRIDNLLDPMPESIRLYKPNPSKGSLEKKIQEEGVIFADRLDILRQPTSLLNGLFDPPKGSLAEKLRNNRIKYIAETVDSQGVIERLFPKDSDSFSTFLRTAVQTAIDISEQTVYEPYFKLKDLRQQLSEASGVKKEYLLAS